MILMLFLFTASPGGTTQEQFEITFDISFRREFIGDAPALVNQEGELLALDTVFLTSKLPPLLEKLGVRDHPLQRLPPPPGYLQVAKWVEYGIILRPDIGNFAVRVELSPLFRPIEGLSLRPWKREKSTISPAWFRFWTSFSGRTTDRPQQPLEHFGHYSNGIALGNWFLFNNGSYQSELNFEKLSDNFLNSWRVERDKYDKFVDSLQFGWIRTPQVVEGQIGGGGVRGIAYSKSFNAPAAADGVIEELPGGMIELAEDSELEIFVDGALIKKFSLSAGRYRLKNFPLPDGIHTIDLRITTRSGRIDERRVAIETSFKDLAKGEKEYVIFGGHKPFSGNSAILGSAFRYGLGSATRVGIHGNIEEQGYRVGTAFQKSFTGLDFKVAAWRQNQDGQQQTGNLTARFQLGDRLMWFGGSGYMRYFKDSDLSATERNREVTLHFTPKLADTMIASLNFGRANKVNGDSGYFLRANRSWTITDNITLSTSISYDDLQGGMAGSFSFTFKPTRTTSLHSSHIVTPDATPTTQLDARQILFGNRMQLGLSYVLADTDRIRTDIQWAGDCINLRAEQNWTETTSGALERSDTSLNYQTSFLLAENSWALVPATHGTFAVIDASALKNAKKLKVRFQGNERSGMFGHFGEGALVPYNANRLTLDPTEVGFGHDPRNEIIIPTPGQAFRILMEPKISLAVVGRLLLPYGEPLANAFGKLHHAEKDLDAEWFTGSNGDFFYEGEPGRWESDVYWKGQWYILRIDLSAEKAVEGVVMLDDLRLTPAE